VPKTVLGAGVSVLGAGVSVLGAGGSVLGARVLRYELAADPELTSELCGEFQPECELGVQQSAVRLSGSV